MDIYNREKTCNCENINYSWPISITITHVLILQLHVGLILFGIGNIIWNLNVSITITCLNWKYNWITVVIDPCLMDSDTLSHSHLKSMRLSVVLYYTATNGDVTQQL